MILDWSQTDRVYLDSTYHGYNTPLLIIPRGIMQFPVIKLKTGGSMINIRAISQKAAIKGKDYLRIKSSTDRTKAS